MWALAVRIPVPHGVKLAYQCWLSIHQRNRHAKCKGCRMRTYSGEDGATSPEAAHCAPCQWREARKHDFRAAPRRFQGSLPGYRRSRHNSVFGVNGRRSEEILPGWLRNGPTPIGSYHVIWDQRSDSLPKK